MRGRAGSEAPHLPHQALIDAHGGGGFRFAGMSHRGSLLRLPDGIWAWPVAAAADLNDDLLALVFARFDAIDFFILGTGDAPWIVPGSLRARFREAHVSLDAMTTSPAVRTYNVLLTEGRRVGAGLIAIGNLASMQDAFAYCAELVRTADRDRYLATLFAPAQHRDALFALYAFAVEIARVRELAHEALPGEIRLQWWSEVVTGERSGEAAANPVAGALLGTIERYRGPAAKLIDLIEAHRFDLYDEPMATIAELEDLREQNIVCADRACGANSWRRCRRGRRARRNCLWPDGIDARVPLSRRAPSALRAGRAS